MNRAVEFGKRLRYLRENRGFTQKELATKIGVAENTVSGYERGIREPDFEKIYNLADILCCSVSYLIDGETGGQDLNDILLIEKFNSLDSVFQRKLVKAVLSLSQEQLDALEETFNNIEKKKDLFQSFLTEICSK